MTMAARIAPLMLFTAMLMALTLTAQATTVQVNSMDAAGTGLKDTTSSAPIGGNPGATLGEQRRLVFEHALNLWATTLSSNVPIAVDVTFQALACSNTGAVLAATSANSLHFNFLNRPIANTAYVQAQANSLAGRDLNTSDADLEILFNSALNGSSSCLSGKTWYYGLDGQPPSNKIDLLAVILHEIGHGLGFATFVDLATGEKFSGLDDAFMHQLEDHSLNKTWSQLSDAQRVASAVSASGLHWKGAQVNTTANLTAGVNQGHVMMYAPADLNLGSSVVHFSNALAPDELMEPFYTGAKYTLGLAPAAMKDLGWNLINGAKPLLAPMANHTTYDSQPLTRTVVVNDVDTAITSVAVSASSANPSLLPTASLSLTGTGNVRQLHITPVLGNSGTTNITLTANDGSRTASVSFQLTLQLNQAPSINLLAPSGGAQSFVSSLHFSATASDAEDGNKTQAINWQSSKDGPLGQGGELDHALSDGSHQITASVTDNQNKTTQQSINITVDAQGDADNDGLSNADEIALGTNPNNPDSDSDGIPDGTDPNPTTPNPVSTPIPFLPDWAMLLLAVGVLGVVFRFTKKSADV
jgi:hypothetical protein